MQTGSSETLIGWKSGQTTFVPTWDRMEGAWLWTLCNLLSAGSQEDQTKNDAPGSDPVSMPKMPDQYPVFN